MRAKCILISCKCRDKSEWRKFVYKFGSFYRKSDKSYVVRFRCRICKRSLSDATYNPCFNQKKRFLNEPIFNNLCSSTSQRRTARLLKTTQKTVARKLKFLSRFSEIIIHELNKTCSRVIEMEFDELETYEHSKLKPISVVVAVESKSRRILGYNVASMPAKGRQYKKSIRKYGKRADHRSIARDTLFSELKDVIDEHATVKSDMNPHYSKVVKKHFPKANFKTFKGKRSKKTDQGELKKLKFDPIFSINHTLAMLRDNIKTLTRMTWATNKKIEGLDQRIAIYAVYHNLVLLRKNINHCSDKALNPNLNYILDFVSP